MNAFEQLEKLRRKPIIATIGGFRPDDEIKSWFGGNFDLKNIEDWPMDKHGYMIPLIQIGISEVPIGKEIFGGIELLQVYISQGELPINKAKNGEGWKLRAFKITDDLRVQITPEGSNI